MIIDITDPSDPAVVGQLFATDIVPDNLPENDIINLFFSTTGSDPNEVLFDLSEPPSFSGPHMVWGRLQASGELVVFLSPTSGDEAHPFATLREFRSLSGSGDLTRFNKLPDQISWSVAP